MFFKTVKLGTEYFDIIKKVFYVSKIDENEHRTLENNIILYFMQCIQFDLLTHRVKLPE